MDTRGAACATAGKTSSARTTAIRRRALKGRVLRPRMIARFPERAKLDPLAARPAHPAAPRQAVAALCDRDDLDHPLPLRLVREHRLHGAHGLVARAVDGDHLVDEAVAQPPQHLCPSLRTPPQRMYLGAR